MAISQNSPSPPSYYNVIEDELKGMNLREPHRGEWSTTDEVYFIRQMPNIRKLRIKKGQATVPLLQMINGYIKAIPLREKGFEKVDMLMVRKEINKLKRQCIAGTIS
tara:strand:+ start:326 stop:646 length:321 start_codon:yes stop_codon:yes gene_type:complete